MDQIATAIAAAERTPEPQPEEQGPEPIALLTLVFMDDGTIRVQSQGVKANQCWAGAGTLTMLGNDLWTRQQDAVRAQAKAADPRSRLVVPGMG